MRIFSFWILLLLISVLGCTDSETGKKSLFGCINCAIQKVDLSKMEPALLDSSFFDPIQIIATYPAKEINPDNSNLYKCIFGRKGDTVFIFELNKKENSNVLHEIDREENGAIINNEILKNPPGSTFIYVPEGFRMPANAKYVFASPTVIEE